MVSEIVNFLTFVISINIRYISVDIVIDSDIVMVYNSILCLYYFHFSIAMLAHILL